MTTNTENGKRQTLLNLTIYGKFFNSHYSSSKECLTYIKTHTYGKDAQLQGPALGLGILAGVFTKLNPATNISTISFFFFHFSHLTNAPSKSRVPYFASSASLSCNLLAKSLSELLCVTSKILTPATTFSTSQFRNSPATRESTP